MGKVAEFVKAHKLEIAIGAITVIGGAVIFAVTKKLPKTSEICAEITDNFKCESWRQKEQEMISALDWKVGYMTDLWNEGKHTHMIVEDISIADLGIFGAECRKLKGAVDESTVSVILGFDGDMLT